MKNVLLVDTTGLMFRLFFRHDTPNTDATLIKMKQDTLNQIMKIKVQEKIDKVILAQEGYSNKSKTNWRIKILDSYKQNRLNDDASKNVRTPIIKTNYFSFIDDLVKNTNFRQISEETCEADDVIASIIQQSNPSQYNFIILTDDKDFQQLIRSNVKIISIKTNTQVSINSYNDIRVHAVIGDSSDNIPQLKKGLGEKGVQKLIENNMLDDFLKNNNLVEDYNRNLSLISLAMIPEDLQTSIKKKFDLAMMNNSTNLEYCTKLIMDLRLRVHLDSFKI